MPSKLEYEFTKLRGEVSTTGEIYTDSIAKLKEAITTAEVAIKSLESAKKDQKTDIEKALKEASPSAITKKIAPYLKKTGGILTGNLTMPAFVTTEDCYMYNDLFMGVGNKINGLDCSSVEDGATADQTGAEIKALYEDEANAYTDTKNTKLAGIATGATIDQTGAQIKALYEGEANTNAYADAEKSKLGTIDSNADVTADNNPKSHGAASHTDRTRSIFLSAPFHSTANSDQYGVRMPDNELTEVAYYFKVPDDFVSIVNFKIIYRINLDPANENVYMNFSAKYGKTGQTYNIHQEDTGYQSINMSSVTCCTFYEYDPSITLSNIAKDDFVNIYMYRNGAHENDTWNHVIFIIGIEITYTADM